ncbi:glycosyltransferase family 9 protein [Campylobacter sp.]|uniref:glycosyltransferase family 9 protein n=1 Tax=Campylobacter sp. TaxID=205 RepID=UPI0025BC113B|nr:glycosyltransferase family 9 protein [Campylobacter sp.]
MTKKTNYSLINQDKNLNKMRVGEYKLYIGYFCPHNIGNMVVSLDMLYAIKHIYQANTIVFCRKNTENILKNFDFIDHIELIDKIDESMIKQINKYPLDYLISFHGKSFLIKLLIKTNAKCIIVRSKFISVFSRKCKIIFTSITKRFFKNKSDRDRMLYYASKIDSKKFDKCLKKINFDTTIKTSYENKNIIQNYLQSNNIKNFIVINPFSISTNFTLNPTSFFILMEKIKSLYPDIDIVIPTYDDIHDIFIRNIKQYNTKLISQIHIFKNNNDILNLAELISQSKCIISPSTGPIHIASNIKIPSIGLYSKKDSIYWPTYNKDYVFIDKKHNELSYNDVGKIISDIINKLQKYIN